MAKRDILIVVKTYPEISKKYTETVCTAGIDAKTCHLRLKVDPPSGGNRTHLAGTLPG